MFVKVKIVVNVVRNVFLFRLLHLLQIVGGCFSSERTEQNEGLCHVKGDYSSSEVDSQDYLLKEVSALLRVRKSLS